MHIYVGLSGICGSNPDENMNAHKAVKFVGEALVFTSLTFGSGMAAGQTRAPDYSGQLRRPVPALCAEDARVKALEAQARKDTLLMASQKRTLEVVYGWGGVFASVVIGTIIGELAERRSRKSKKAGELPGGPIILN